MVLKRHSNASARLRRKCDSDRGETCPSVGGSHERFTRYADRGSSSRGRYFRHSHWRHQRHKKRTHAKDERRRYNRQQRTLQRRNQPKRLGSTIHIEKNNETEPRRVHVEGWQRSIPTRRRKA